jgi:hypothetical protein
MNCNSDKLGSEDSSKFLHSNALARADVPITAAAAAAAAAAS